MTVEERLDPAPRKCRRGGIHVASDRIGVERALARRCRSPSVI